MSNFSEKSSRHSFNVKAILASFLPSTDAELIAQHIKKYKALFQEMP